MNVSELVDADVAACTSLANFVVSDFVESFSADSGVSSLALAALPSVALAHDHLPTTKIVHGCAYCELYGNIFEAPVGTR